jgi:hypothetical protein
MSHKIVEHNDSIKLSLIHPIYKTTVVYTVDEGGNTVEVKHEKFIKEISVKKWFRKDSIDTVEEYVTSKNKVAKNRSIIHDSSSGTFYQTYHNPDELWFVLRKEPDQIDKNIGFKR